MAKKTEKQENEKPTENGQDFSSHRWDFELDRAIRDQVLEKLNSSPMVPLEKNCSPQTSGVYALYFKGELVYIGKASRDSTKSKRTLRARLNEHCGKLSGRENLSITQMKCRFLTIDSDWFVWAAEFALIHHFKPEWNGSGYGSKTPGKGRPGTDRISKWNQMFPLKATKKNEKVSESLPAEGLDDPLGNDASE